MSEPQTQTSWRSRLGKFLPRRGALLAALAAGAIAFFLASPLPLPTSRQPASDTPERTLGMILRRTNDPRLTRSTHPHGPPPSEPPTPARAKGDAWATKNRLPLPAVPAAVDPCTDPYPWVCQSDSRRGWRRRDDPTGSMSSGTRGELFTLRILEEAYQNQDPEKSTEQNRAEIEQEVMRRIYLPARTGRIREGFKWVRGAFLDFIEEQPEQTFTRAQKKALRKKLKDVTLELPPETPYRDEPELYTRNDAFYERLQNGATRLRIGGAYLHSSKSWFNLVFTLAHELAHAIDPCELKALHMAPSSYDRLSTCFLATGIVASRALRQECGENDQLSEAFADWIAVQITSRALQSYGTEFQGPQLRAAAANAVADLCDEDDSIEEHDDLTHPSPRVRIERIFGRNPKIRDILGCSASSLQPSGTVPSRTRARSAFCDFNWQPFDD